ncbi:helix-turn-helix transcriptional regulator [Carboxylicivirga sediminis]|uniref:Helix-turn-helix transcriptional regulator n=1 Tax=Carboxylicivirga sediminis TaxID=2006564 RepID=A0A941F3S7_9BACT|nr:helix-turn-helix domain-containing protein [Carboxylicivirga sediminis]MBR8535847.1 helix-turn-helix transcriptional regulator [Carboxylicivirga sediminis]
MAIDSFECKIITGGYSHCDSSWNKRRDELDQCFKIYIPTEGEASIRIKDVDYCINSNNIYFISGFQLNNQKCDSFMKVYWLHFIPTSLYLRRILMNSAPFFSWKKENVHFLDEKSSYIKSLFKPNYKDTTFISQIPYSYEEAKLHAFILSLIADVLKHNSKAEISPTTELMILKPAIDFMNNEFRRNPALEEIAKKSNLAPNYFHRLFKKNFGLTPLNYMLRMRMEIAVRLLTTTAKSVKEIAYEAGYNNEFYFYRQFKKHYNYSPGRLKKMRPF